MFAILKQTVGIGQFNYVFVWFRTSKKIYFKKLRSRIYELRKIVGHISVYEDSNNITGALTH